MIRFIHTADWQIGMNAKQVGGAANRVREQRLNAATRVVEIARERAADFIALTGDTFENNGVDRVFVQKVADILGKFGKPVYMIPGNHDPLVPGSVWEHPSWSGHRNLHILRDNKPFEIAGGWLFPCPCLNKHSGLDSTRSIDTSTVAGIKVGLAHGTVEGLQVDEKDYPIARDAAARAGLDYLAIGHWHSFSSYPDSKNEIHMAYSGTHETTKFGERDSGNVLLVEIQDTGVAPKIESIKTGELIWLTWDKDLRQAGDLGRVREELEKIDKPGTTLLDCRLTGLINPGDQNELTRLTELATARLLYHRVDISRLRLSPSDTNWISELPVGVIREAAAKLQQLSDPAYIGSRPPNGTPELASRAILELYAIKQVMRK